MRTLLTGEQALALAGDVDVYVKLEVQNGSGTWKDVGALLGSSWIINATWGEHIDTPVSSATFTLVQQIGENSLAPLIATSVLNVLDDGITYSPLLDIARLVRASSAVMPRGVALNVSKYREIFTGRIDDVNTPDSPDMMGPITIACSDLGSWLMDLQIETEGKEYGTTPVGTPLETVLQAVINDNIPAGDPAVTVVKSSSSGYAVTAWAQGETKVMEALQTLVLDSTGEDVRYRYNASHVSELTWFDPNRGRVTVDGTVGTDEYVARTLSLSLANVRNAIEMPYSDPATGVSGTVLAEDLASISKNRRRYNRIGASAMIGTQAEAQAVVNAVVSDLSDAPAEIAAECHYLWFVQLYDRYTFTANGRQFTDDQTLAVSGYQHTVTNGQAVTTLTLAGRVVGAYGQWVRRLAPGSAVDRSLSILRINSKESADGSTRDFTVLVGTRVETLFVHYRTVTITETEDIYDFSATAVLPADGASPLVLTPAARVVTFSIPQPARDYAVAMRLVPVAAGSLQGDSVLVKVDAAPPGINVVTHATKTGNLARLEIDVEFGPSDGPVSVAVIERVLGVPTTLLTHAMTASGTIDWTTNIELDARPIPANADSISWTVQLTDVSGAVWTFGPTYALTSAVLINAVNSEAAGVGTVTVTVTDAGAYLKTDYSDAGIVSQMSWHVTRLGVTTVKASTTVPALGATSGTYTLVETLDPLHPIVVSGFVHYVDGDTECFFSVTFDSDKISDVVNATVATANGVATVTAVWDSDTLVGANCVRYSVDGGAWVSTVTVSAGYLSQFTVAQTAAKQTVVIQAKNAVDAGATWGNQATLEIGVSDTGPSLDVRAQPGVPSAGYYSIIWSGSAGITVAIDAGAYGTPAASPIVVARHATNDIVYSFKGTLNGQDVTNTVTIPSLDKDTVTPNLTVVPGTPTATELSFTVTCSNPGGGSAPTVIIKLVGCTATGYSDGDSVTSGATVVVQRPAFGTTAQATVKFIATISGGGSEEIGRTIQNQVKDSFGPSLEVVPTPGTTTYDIAYTATGTLTYSIDGGSYTTPPSSPITGIARNAVGGASKTYVFKCVKDGQTINASVVIPPQAAAAPSTDPTFDSVSWSASPDYTADTIDLSFTYSNAPGGATFDAVIYEQTHATRDDTGKVFTAVGVSPGYTYQSRNDIDAAGSLTKLFRHHINMYSGSTLVAQSAEASVTLNSNT